jgi:hypothetical protein
MTKGNFIQPLQSMFDLVSMGDGDFDNFYDDLKANSYYHVLGRVILIYLL